MNEREEMKLRREDEEIIQAERELGEFVYYTSKITWMEEQLKELDAKLESYGVSSPKILSLEEAKYQKGTRLYSDANLLQIFSEQDEIEREIVFCRTVISRVCRKLVAMNLDEYQTDLLYYRFEKKLTYEQIANITGYSRQAVQWQMELLLKIFGTR